MCTDTLVTSDKPRTNNQEIKQDNRVIHNETRDSSQDIFLLQQTSLDKTQLRKWLYLISLL